MTMVKGFEDVSHDELMDFGGGGYFKSVAIGAGIGAGKEMFNQWRTTGGVHDWGKVGDAAATGALVGAFGYPLASKLKAKFVASGSGTRASGVASKAVTHIAGEPPVRVVRNAYQRTVRGGF